MEFLSKAYTWLAELSSKLPEIDFKAFFIVVVAAVVLAGAITFATYLGSGAYRLKKACKRVIKYLASADTINDDNVSEFTAQCFSIKAPQSLRDTWVQYLGVRFGYPSEIISERSVFDVEVKNNADLRPPVFIGVALILVGIFAFWGFGTLDGKDMAIIHCVGLLLSGAIFLGLTVMSRKQRKNCADAFSAMLEDLDAKVHLQVDRNYATDSSPLLELTAVIEEIIARNTAKDIEAEPPAYHAPETPLEELIQQADSITQKTAGKKDKIVSTFSPKPLEQNFDFDSAINAKADEADTAVSENEQNTEQKSFDIAPETGIAPVEQEQSDVDDSSQDMSASTSEIVEEEVKEVKEDNDVAQDNADNGDKQESDQQVSENGFVAVVAPSMGDESQSSESETEGGALETAASDIQLQTDDIDFAILDGDGIERLIKEIVREELDKLPTEEKKPQPNQKPLRVLYLKSKEQKQRAEEEQRRAANEEEKRKAQQQTPKSRLSKLPELISLMSERNMTRAMKMNIAKMLIVAYKSFDGRPDDKKIIVDCLNTVIKSLQQQND